MESASANHVRNRIGLRFLTFGFPRVRICRIDAIASVLLFFLLDPSLALFALFLAVAHDFYNSVPRRSH